MLGGIGSIIGRVGEFGSSAAPEVGISMASMAMSWVELGLRRWVRVAAVYDSGKVRSGER